MDHAEQVSRSALDGTGRRRAALVAVLLALTLAGEVAAQLAGLFTPAEQTPSVATALVSPTPPDPLTLRSRLVTIDLGHLTPTTTALSSAAELPSTPPVPVGVLRLNPFDDAVFTGIVEWTAPTFSGGYVLSGQLLGVEEGTLTLVVNGDVVAGNAAAVSRIRSMSARREMAAEVKVDLSLERNIYRYRLAVPHSGPKPPQGGKTPLLTITRNGAKII